MRSGAHCTMAVWIACAAGLAAAPVAGRAADDGGTRSVFAYGAGNRALAMGGAFTAVCDDASAAIWNPGGLGIVPTRQLQASWAKLYDLEVTENYLSFVLPSWRFGTAGVAVRTLGVEGIDGRDERNLPTQKNLNAGEMEILFGYGRSLLRGLSAGSSIKVRRQSIAGYHADALGADVGILARPGEWIGRGQEWLGGFTLGAALYNVLEPSIRLDAESVADPLAARFGLAYGSRLLRSGSLLASIDLERTADIDPRLRAGIELRIHPMIALRSGMDHGTPTAGVGLDWRGASFDYFIADGDLGEVHRFGFSLRMGATTEERRLAAIRAQEAEVEVRLAEAYQTRQSERGRELLAAATTAFNEGRHDDALAQLGLANALTPDRPEARSLEAACWKAKAEILEKDGAFAEAALSYDRAAAIAPEDSAAARRAQQCRVESDRRATRSDQLKKQFAGALDAFGSGDLGLARKLLRSLLETEPADAEAAAMLKRTESAIGRRTEELLEQADRYLRAGLNREAAAAAAKAKALDRNAKGLQRVEDALASTRTIDNAPPQESERSTAPSHQSQRIEPTAAGPAGRTVTAEERREIEVLYRRGMDALESGRNEEAVRYWELVHSIDPSYQQVHENLKREYLMAGMDSFAAGRLEEAVNNWEKALRIDPTDEKAMGYLSRARQQLARTREILGSSNR